MTSTTAPPPSGINIPRWFPALVAMSVPLGTGAIAYGRLEERVASGFAASDRRQDSNERRVEQHEVRLTANELLAGRVDAKLDILLERSEHTTNTRR